MHAQKDVFLPSNFQNGHFAHFKEEKEEEEIINISEQQTPSTCGRPASSDQPPTDHQTKMSSCDLHAGRGQTANPAQIAFCNN